VNWVHLPSSLTNNGGSCVKIADEKDVDVVYDLANCFPLL
jgi:hypothetical protein